MLEKRKPAHTCIGELGSCLCKQKSLEIIMRLMMCSNYISISELRMLVQTNKSSAKSALTVPLLGSIAVQCQK